MFHFLVLFKSKAHIHATVIMCVRFAINSSLSSLKVHMKTVHGGERNHVCEICDKSFSLARNLKRLIAIVHHRESAHICEVCNKTLVWLVTSKFTSQLYIMDKRSLYVRFVIKALV